MEIITAGDGTAHVSSADDGAVYAGIAGPECYVTNVGDKLSCSMQTSNKALIGTGVGIMYGRAFRISIPEEVSIDSGSQNQRRNDIICAHFTTSSDGKESGALSVIKGTPSSGPEAEDPEVPDDSILDGATEAYMPLYRIPLDGITVGDPEPLFDILAPMSDLKAQIDELRDSVSQTVLLLSEDLTVPGGKMHVDVYDVPAIRELVMRVSGSINSTDKIFKDFYTSGKIPKDKLPSTSVNCALAQYEGTWGRFCARAGIMDDGRARLSIIAPQAIQTGYTTECRISYAF